MPMSLKNKLFLNANDPSSLGQPPAAKPAPKTPAPAVITAPAVKYSDNAKYDDHDSPRPELLQPGEQF